MHIWKRIPVSGSFAAQQSHSLSLSDLQHSAPPIRVTPKMRGNSSKRRNVFMGNRGFPDQSNEFDSLLHNIDGGTILCKHKHPAPKLNNIDPQFHVVYNDKLHGKQLRQYLNLSHLVPSLRAQVYGLIQKYYSVFADKGQFVPVKDYSCMINTGSAKPIAIMKINYGPQETPIMEKCIASLAKLGHIHQIHNGEWLFKALLAPKPHQEGVTNIADFIWRFCVNYIPLNQITHIVAHPIP